MIANDDASDDSTKSLEKETFVSQGASGVQALVHPTSIHRVSPSRPDENRFSIELGVNKNLKGMACMLKRYSIMVYFKVVSEVFGLVGGWVSMRWWRVAVAQRGI